MSDDSNNAGKSWAQRIFARGRDTTRQRKAVALVDALWRDYVTLNPHAKAVHDALVAHGEKPLNDHIAFRTFDCGNATMRVLARTFEDLGWSHGGDYDIKEKKVTALHLNPPPMSDLPKVFISELRVGEFSPDFRQIVYGLVRQVSPIRVARADFLCSGTPWQAVPWIRYRRLAQESEYAAWVAAFGYRANHFTVLVNELRPALRDIRALNDFIKSQGHRLNASGGEVKGSPQQLLEQSSTMAGKVPVKFLDGARVIPACYYEFAKRYPKTPNGLLFQGFIESSATRIFDSTNATAPTKPSTNGGGKVRPYLYEANTQNRAH